jgi:hypothetical protein
MSKFIYEKTLIALEKLDKRDSTFKKIAYKTLYKVYIKSFTKAFNMSPFDKKAQCGHDLYLEMEEYNA